MADLQGFWSYVHDDDNADGGRISRLARDVVEQYAMLTGENISLFSDKDDLEWGEDWRARINNTLSSIAFFIPIITPRYFMSPECRRELQFFARQARKIGIEELILPLLYVDFPDLHDQNTKDNLIKLVNTFQWEDWCELRFSEVKSEAYRRGVTRLAKHLVEANRQAEETITAMSAQLEEATEESIDDSPGIIDLLANSEEKLLKLPETLSSMTQDIKQIGQVMREATDDIHRADAQGQGFGARLIIARRTANRLSEPTERIWSQSNVYASQIHDVDEGFRILIERAPSEIERNSNAKQEYCTLFESIREMSDASVNAVEGAKSMISASEALEKLSRDLRPVVRRLKQGLIILIESTEVSEEWVNLIDSTGIICEDKTTMND